MERSQLAANTGGDAERSNLDTYKPLQQRRKVFRLTVNRKSMNAPAPSLATSRRVRKLKNTRTVWIDAICINQADPSECGHQVQMMGDTYSNGIRNLAYLGELDLTRAFRATEAVVGDCYHRCLDRNGGICNCQQGLQMYNYNPFQLFGYRKPTFSTLVQVSLAPYKMS